MLSNSDSRIPAAVVKANRRVRDNWRRRLGLAALQPRVPRAARPVDLGRQRDAEGVPAHARRAARRLTARRRPDRRRVPVTSAGAKAIRCRGADLRDAAAGRHEHDRTTGRPCGMYSGRTAVARDARAGTCESQEVSADVWATPHERRRGGIRRRSSALGRAAGDRIRRCFATAPSGAFWECLRAAGRHAARHARVRASGDRAERGARQAARLVSAAAAPVGPGGRSTAATSCTSRSTRNPNQIYDLLPRQAAAATWCRDARPPKRGRA